MWRIVDYIAGNFFVVIYISLITGADLMLINLHRVIKTSGGWCNTLCCFSLLDSSLDMDEDTGGNLKGEKTIPGSLGLIGVSHYFSFFPTRPPNRGWHYRKLGTCTFNIPQTERSARLLVTLFPSSSSPTYAISIAIDVVIDRAIICISTRYISTTREKGTNRVKRKEIIVENRCNGSVHMSFNNHRISLL